GRVDDDVIGERDQLAHLGVRVRGRVRVDLAAELLAGEPRLGDRARRRAGEVLADERERRPLREALEREQDRAAGALLHARERLQVVLERAEIGDEARRLEVRHVDRARDVLAERSSLTHRSTFFYLPGQAALGEVI